MIKNMLSYVKIDKDRRDEIIGKYVLPIVIFLGITLFGIALFIATKCKRGEEILKRIVEKWNKWQDMTQKKIS